MKNFAEIVVSENLEKLANKLKSKAELFIVGGYVRNCLLGIGGTDIDLASKLTVDRLAEILQGSNFVVEIKNQKLGTAKISIGNESYEYSTFRIENYDNSGKHSPVVVEFVDDIRQDARRRDFTINAIYYSLTRKKIVDIYSGLYDLKKKRVKTIETPEFVFSCDGLRILRMIRISSELGFGIEKNTYNVARKMSYKLKDITGIRKQQELELILNANKKYSISKNNAHIKALVLFNKINLWSSFYCNVSKIKLCMTKRVKANKICAVFIDMIKTVDPDDINLYLENMLGEKGLGYSNKQKDFIKNVVCGYFDAIKKLNNKEYFFKYYENFDKIKVFIAKNNIFLYNKYNFFYKYITNYNIPITIKDLCVNGDDIKKCRPRLAEKHYGKLLNVLLNKVFDGEVNNTKEELIREIKTYDYRNN